MKIDRAIIIRRLKVDLSLEYAQMCAESCDKHNVPYEYLDGIEFMSSEDAYKAVGMRIGSKNKYTQGNNNCNASHIKAWQRIVELNVPCLILEHDTIVKGEVTNIDIPEMSIVAFGNRIHNLESYEPIGPIDKLVEIKKNMGAHAYAITPDTAKYLLSHGEPDGVNFNVDVHLMIDKTSGLPLYMTEPPQVVCWPRVSTRELSKDGTPRYEMAPTWTFVEASTPGWAAGCKLP